MSVFMVDQKDLRSPWAGVFENALALLYVLACLAVVVLA